VDTVLRWVYFCLVFDHFLDLRHFGVPVSLVSEKVDVHQLNDLILYVLVCFSQFSILNHEGICLSFQVFCVLLNFGGLLPGNSHLSILSPVIGSHRLVYCRFKLLGLLNDHWLLALDDLGPH
jgi:hypothetical protein